MNSLLLTREGCLERQRRLREKLVERDFAAAMIVHPHHIHYFTGWWMRPIFSPVLVVTREASVLALPSPTEDPAITDSRVIFTGSINATMIDDPYDAALKALEPAMKGVRKLAVDSAPGALLSRGFELSDLGPILRSLKRTKLPDEVEIIRKAIKGTAESYAWMRENLGPGVNELDVYAQTQAAAVRCLAEPLGEFGNDFTCGDGGGAPRDRAARAGELYILDLSVVLRGYSSDLCRTFAVSESTDIQRDGARRCAEVLEHVEANARPGVRCRALHEVAIRMLDGYKGFSFGHHLGHGIGLCPHESPRLNKAWDDTLQEGDVFTCEPGMYGDALGTGIRIEDDYLVTASGVERLSAIDRSLGR